MRSVRLKSLKFSGMRHEMIKVLKGAILNGAYEPGQQMFEAELAKQLQVSRGPVREALLQLEKEGLVKHIHNKGWFVINLTPEEISQITSLRAVLEVLTLRLAKERISIRGLAKLNEIQKGMLEAFTQGQIDDAIQGDFNFHEQIWKISDHKVLYEVLVKVTTPHFAFFKMAKVWNELELTALGRGLENHQAMIDFLAGKTRMSAERCIRNHFEPTHFKNWNVLLDLIHKLESE